MNHEELTIKLNELGQAAQCNMVDGDHATIQENLVEILEVAIKHSNMLTDIGELLNQNIVNPALLKQKIKEIMQGQH